VAPPPELLQAAADADAIAFTSGSSVDGYVRAAGVGAIPPVVVTIGPVTSAAVVGHGLAVEAEADPHSLAGLVEATVAALS
jgi:uroporphyrinogen-III synthase